MVCVPLTARSTGKPRSSWLCHTLHVRDDLVVLCDARDVFEIDGVGKPGEGLRRALLKRRQKIAPVPRGKNRNTRIAMAIAVPDTNIVSLRIERER